MNRVQTLMIAFFALAWIGLVVILAVAPDIYDRTLPVSDGSRRAEDGAFLLVVAALIRAWG